MSKRKLVKTKTTSKKPSGTLLLRVRPLFVAGLVLSAVTAGWLAVSARSTPQPMADGGSQVVALAATLGASTPSTVLSPVTANDESSSAAAASGQGASGPAQSSARGTAAKSANGTGTAAASPAATPPPRSGLHRDVVTTIFWAGEAAGADNAGISNVPSAWDESWQEHYGGYDDPDNRNGYHPAGFTPKENPFYFALPYNDYDEHGNRRSTAKACSEFTGETRSSTSWCKNAWIRITKGGKSAYAQWQDVGPLGENDYDYVFGTARWKNSWGAKAGLDVSPAVRDYLGLKGVDTVSWEFVKPPEVAAGPWKSIVTTSGVYWH